MNPKIIFGLALLGCAFNCAQALFLGTLAAAGAGTGTAFTFTGIGATAGTTGFLTASGAALGVAALGGVAILKIAAIAAIASQQRGKRSADDESDFAVNLVAAGEPAACYRRLICDLATGTMEKSENDVIVSLFDKQVSANSPKFDFVTAATIGKQVRSQEVCEVRYSCPLTGQQIQKLFKSL